MLAIGQENLWNLDFNALPPFYSKLLAIVFICINAILLNFVFNSLEFYDKFNYLPSIIYVLLVFLFPISLRFGEDLLGHLFFILAFNQLLSIRQNDDARNHTFLSGLFLGIAATFLPVYFLFIFVIWFGLFTIRPFVFREYLLPLVALIFPFLWIVLVNPYFIDEFFDFDSTLNFSRFGEFLILLPHIVIIVLAILANKKILERRLKSSIRFKRIIAVTFIALLFSASLSVVILLFFDTYFYFTIGAAILPFVLPFAYLEVKNKWLPNILFYALIILNIVKFLF
ncbi:hypothetical protein CW751_01005 [Brumimicrobium salinarum]|uniref:Beta-carotene 15,15'-monooxygenase n=1 Tax=Brumimicrobium salinarum TaxID=2058658 RepID=A0A2I0R5U2_9FLAO|nr:hypothetical protein [Brumimicrobium salinarum]PKR81946.1 hypothetical protein CW751_01005 [Brumimicrobium salinarum]